MNLGELKTRAIQKLRERPTPRHWSEAEIQANLNLGVKQLVRDAGLKKSLIALSPVDLANGLFAVPVKILKQTGVLWSGKDLPQTSVDFLDAHYRGTTARHTIGSAELPFGDWRGMTAEDPLQWLIDEDAVRLFPIPEALATAEAIRRILSGTLLAGAVDIPLDDWFNYPYDPVRSSLETTKLAGSRNALLPGSLYAAKDAINGETQVREAYSFSLTAGDPADFTIVGTLPVKDQVAVYVNGIRQRGSEWVRVSDTRVTIGVVPVTFASDVTVEIVSLYMDCETYESTLTAGDVAIACAGATLTASDQLVSVYLNGVYQNSDQWSITDATTVTMVGALGADADVEVVVELYGSVVYLQPKRYLHSLSAGETSMEIYGRHPRGIAALALHYNGIKQNDGLLVEDDSYSITIPAPVVSTLAEITVYRCVYPVAWRDSGIEMFSSGLYLYHDDFEALNLTTLDSFVRLTNQPVEVVQWAVERRVWTRGFVAANTSAIAVSDLETTDNGLVDVVVNGAKLNNLEWSFSATGITLASPPVNDFYIEIVRLDDEILEDYNPIKYLLPLVAGDTTIDTPAGSLDEGGFVVGGAAVALVVDGVKTYPSAYTETSSELITLDSPAAASGTLEMTIFDRNKREFVAEKSLLCLFLNGVYQNQDQWDFIRPGVIRMVGPLVVDATYEVVYWHRGSTTGIRQRKFTLSLPAGVQSFATPIPYEVGANAIAVRINGITQAPSAFTETSSTRITLASALTWASDIEITIYERLWAGEVAMKCVRAPEEMVSDTDVPDLPTHLEAYHEAILYWALFECFSREGQEKDMAMAQFYAQRYSGVLTDVKQLFAPPIEVSPRDAWVV